MKKLLYGTFIFIYSCHVSNERKKEIEPASDVDSVLVKSRSLHDSGDMILKSADEKTQEKVEQVVNQVGKLENINQSLANENKNLKQSLQVTKSVIIRDTIYITEKRNFWGKTRKTIDSAKSIEDTTIIDTLDNK